MTDTLERKISRFEQNREAVKKSGFLTDERIAAACACLFALNDAETTTEEIKAAKELLKSKVGILSNFRGYSETAIACMLSSEPEQEALMEKSVKAYNCLKKKFIFAEYLPLAAVMTAKAVPESEYETIAERTHTIYKLIKKDHPILTGEEDELMCVLLALQTAEPEQQAENCELCYQHLKGHFGIFASGDGLQSLAEVLAAAGGNLEENSQRAVELYEYFKEQDSAISNGYALGALGALAILPVPVEELGKQVIEAADMLESQKGYGGLFGITKGSRMIHAALLTASDYAADENGVLAAIQGTITAIIAEETMILCTVAATTAASSAS